jgi:preprotein translocase subunit YajC
VLAHHLAFTLLAATSNGKSSNNGYGTLVLLAIVALAVVMFSRSQRNKQRRAVDQRKAITVGAEVVTTAGLIAQVVDMDDETVTLEIAPGVHSRFLRQAIVRVVEPPAPDEPEPDVSEPTDSTGDDTTTGRTG